MMLLLLMVMTMTNSDGDDDDEFDGDDNGGDGDVWVDADFIYAGIFAVVFTQTIRFPCVCSSSHCLLLFSFFHLWSPLSSLCVTLVHLPLSFLLPSVLRGVYSR